ncbi:kinesin-like protein KIF28 isoform X2 [Centruroides vittatus]|uniref:kinesin-like protein KIF28 isoform X2 n=1 Tax=Centruroides vittatus TaxID=120091 RepID=UPI00350FED1F
MPEVENVKVAVRVRPFNQREKQRNAKNIVTMRGKITLLYNPDAPKEQPKKFTYDYSYWSHDGYRELENGYCTPDPDHRNGSIFCDQEKIYNELGKGILHNAWEGYNSTLFAYGQTGSGKSWSVVGYGINKGIVPRFCEDMFNGIEDQKKSGDNTEFEVRFSMLEIYNEIVRDLLNPTQDRKRGLKVREHPKKGFYAEGLKTFLVTQHKDIESRIDEGTTNRSIASTNMNATSSRAHTIVGITLIQKTKRNEFETSKTSVVNLVDLAGSERVATTGATGDRLKESAAINQSLSCLGKCIHALAERAGGKNVRVPYRESVLTRLLMNALGGNSKTIMIAAISPADINYEETFSTLRYADRAKQIKTVAIINEDPTEKLIRELREENEKLKRMLEKGAVDIPVGPGMTKEEIERLKKKWEEEMKAAMAENNREIKEIKQSYGEKLDAAKRHQEVQEEEKLKLEEEKKKYPHLANLNFDPQLSGKIVHILKFGDNVVGKGDVDIVLLGPSIQPEHALIRVQTYGGVTLEKCTNDARVLINGDSVSNKISLQHNDRIMFGTTQLYIFINPEERNKSNKKYPEITYEMAQEEIAIKAGINMASEDNSRETALLNKDLLEVLPGVEEANAISEELDKRVKFEILLIAPQLLGKLTGRTEVYVKMRNLETSQEFEWPKEKFLNRLYVMKEMYQNYEMGEEEWDLPPERDPFLEDPETDVRIGNVQVYLQPLAYLVELKEQLEIIDYKGSEVGMMNVEIVPCSPEGLEYTENDDMFIDNPLELIERDLHFIFKIHGCRGLPTRFTDIHCRYRVYLDKEDTVTEVISDTSNPDFNHKKLFSFHPVTPQMIDYIQDGYITVQVWGKQKPRKSAIAKAKGKSTKQMFQADLMNQANNLMNGFRINGRSIQINKA